MTGVRANVTPVSFFILLLHYWGDTKPQVFINDSVSDTEFPSLSQSHTRSMAETLGQNQQHLISEQRLLANETIGQAKEKSRSIEKYAEDSLNDLWIDQILNTLKNRMGKMEGSQADVSQSKAINELFEDLSQPIHLDKAYEEHMVLPENLKDSESDIGPILETPKKRSDFHQNTPPSTSVLTVLKKIVITCMIVTSSLSALVLLVYICASLCMKSHPREPPVNNTYNIYITEEMKKNPDAVKEIFSDKTKEDNDRLSSDIPDLQNKQSPRHSIKESESKGKLLTQNSNYNNRSIHPGDFMKGQIMPLKGFIVQSYGNKSRIYKNFVSSSEISDSDTIQTRALANQLSDIPGSLLKKEYMEKKDPNKVSGSHKEPDSLSHSQHKLNSPDQKHQYKASPDSLNYAEETQSDTYPSSNSTENAELVDNHQTSTLLGTSSSSSWSSHSD